MINLILILMFHNTKYNVLWVLGHNIPDETNNWYIYDTLLPYRRHWMALHFPTYVSKVLPKSCSWRKCTRDIAVYKLSYLLLFYIFILFNYSYTNIFCRLSETTALWRSPRTTFVEGEFSVHVENYFKHYSECFQRYLLLESTLVFSEVATGHTCFPMIFRLYVQLFNLKVKIKIFS